MKGAGSGELYECRRRSPQALLWRCPLRSTQYLYMDSLEPGAEEPPMDAWPWSNNEEEPPFTGLPPLPKAFREPSLSSSPLPGKKGQEVDKELEGSTSSLQDKITWVHGELRRLRLADQVLFNQLYTLALEIQDLKELHQEMETLSKEELLADAQGHQAGEINAATQLRPAAAFELTI